MALAPINLAAVQLDGRTVPYQVNTSGLKEGAVVVVDSSVVKGAAKAPTGTADAGVVGVIVDVLPSGGTTSGLDYDIQNWGDGYALLKASTSVTVGDLLVTGGTDGSVIAYVDGTHDNCDVVGRSKVTRTAGAAAELIPITLNIFRVDKS
jgi:hypothetical protein